ncbi:electron transport complex subunit RsxG [Oxobacter pfennigii]|uniref:Electron transport complex subunit RsxG n=1 Tax=Oxobacter pfennigii TaxID=36849 RepID=A0A0P9AEL0_9CLOT|nr:FMN-binding protein [Oxobacter pfennigii]KPU43754.1 electron transport complex subunit RsxG [Oxobacter pfennigii]
MKLLNKLTSFFLILCFVLAFSGCGGTNKESEKYTPGTYKAAVKGFNGDVTVTITVDADKITNVSVEGPKETPNIGGQAVKELSENIISKQSAEIDIVSGATTTSNAAIEAAKTALAEAKAEVK